MLSQPILLGCALSAFSLINRAFALPISSHVIRQSNIGDFGSCSVPQIEFATGFDNRKETSFQPTDKTSYNHGSAQNIDIITQFMCDQLTNSCKADQTAKDTCASAKAAADTKTAKTGAQADAFNAVFNIKTNFAAVAAVDDQGNVIAGSTSGDAASSGSASASASATDSATDSATATATSADSSASATASAGSDGSDACVATVTVTATVAGATDAATSGNVAATNSSASGIGDFGKCSVPQIEFATGFDNRKETSFQPTDKTSYNHGSAQNIDIITQFMCDTLTNSCGADQTAKDTCASAKAAADQQTAKTGAQADAFNKVFGISTNFAAVTAIDDQGNPIAGTGSGSASAGSSATTAAAASASSTDAASASSTAAASASSKAAASASSSAAASATSSAASSTSTAASGASGNLQTFTGSLGGVTAPAVSATGDGQFQVSGNSSFKNIQNALVRSCDVQHNQCANAANASGNKGDLTVAACGDQQNQCNAAAQSAKA